MSKLSEEQLISSLIERARDITIDLAAARERELEDRFAEVSGLSRLKLIVLSILRKFPPLFRLALKIKSLLR